jgi:hypothetical protein
LFGNNALGSIPAINRIPEQRAPIAKGVHVTDVTACIKAWGRRGIAWGAGFGFALGTILVAIPLSTDILTFGVIGTMVVAAVECAVIAGGFAALAAALFGEGSGSHGRTEPTSTARRRVAEASWRNGDVSVAEWPKRWPSAVPTPSLSLPVALPLESDGDWSTAPLLQNIQTRLDTIDAWENGNTGP